MDTDTKKREKARKPSCPLLLLAYPVLTIVLLSSILMLFIAIERRRKKISHMGLPISDNYFVRGPRSAFVRVK
jgi:hypothetical protein